VEKEQQQQQSSGDCIRSSNGRMATRWQ